jgi:NAD kinase
MKIKNVLLAEKTTKYEKQLSERTFFRAPAEKQAEILGNHELHRASVRRICSRLKELKIGFDHVKNDELEPGIDFSMYDARLVAGGDGSVLRAVQLSITTPVLGINTTHSHTNNGSAGGLCSITQEELGRLDGLVTGGYTLIASRMLCASLNGQPLPYHALNDIALGPSEFYKTIHVDLEIGPIKASFPCTCVVCSSALGSRAWYHNITGGNVIDTALFAYGVALSDSITKRIKLPFSSMVVDGSTPTVLMPQSPSNVLVYDANEATKIPIATNDRIEVYLSRRTAQLIRL